MLKELLAESETYLVTGYTDLRRGIDGLAGIIQGKIKLDPYSQSVFLFCGRKRDRIKGLLWEGDGFLLLYKRLDPVLVFRDGYLAVVRRDRLRNAAEVGQRVVAVFDNGHVAEYGTHTELYAQGGIYTEMFDKQAQFYRESAQEIDKITSE